MALKTKTFAITDATLSNGAQTATASGDLPARITTADIQTFTRAGYGNGQNMQLHLLSDNGVLVCNFSTNTLTRYNSDGTELWNVPAVTTGTGPLGVDYDASINEVYTGDYTDGNVSVWNYTTGAFIREWSAGTQPSCIAVTGTDQIWVAQYDGNDLVREYDRNGAATGRTLASFASTMVDMKNYEGTHILYASTAHGWRRRRISDDSNETIGSIGTIDGSLGNAFNAFYQRAVAYDGTDVFTVAILPQNIDRFNSSLVVQDRVAIGGYLTGAWNHPGAQSTQQYGFDVNSDYVLVRDEGGIFTRFDRRTQRARFTWAPGEAVTTKRFVVSGRFGNEEDASFTQTKTRFYYSFDGGVNRTEFKANDTTSFSVTALQVVTIDCDMVNLNSSTGIPPFIGDNDSGAITILYEITDLGISAAASDSETVRVTFDTPVDSNAALTVKDSYTITGDTDVRVLSVAAGAGTQPAFVDLTTDEMSNNASYTVQIDRLTTSGENLTSPTAAFTGVGVSPSVIRTTMVRNILRIEFSEEMNPDDLLNTGNYTFSPAGPIVTAAQIATETNNTAVHLTLDNWATSTNYIVTVGPNVRDKFGNNIA